MLSTEFPWTINFLTSSYVAFAGFRYLGAHIVLPLASPVLELDLQLLASLKYPPKDMLRVMEVDG